ncbi:hypothetical protein MLD38_011395 [Melastoma candidum]|uniref:Uncharacterized protein n=1 Tax=Melastoma candidum TaxID=119954 RepID=A0ACB9R3G6_9MYRT|nr:hypothetical protein MLD38_011395 [Melastoma candidum]
MGTGEGEESLLSPPTKVELGSRLWEEAKRTAYIAGPMVAVNLSLYFLQIISTMMVGHLGELYLSSTALAVSFCAVTGFSLIFGLSSGLETLCGQSYGARQYHRFGTQIHTGVLSLVVSSLPLSLLWLYLERILTLVGQDPEISAEAGRFAVRLIPALYAYAVLQPLIRYYQTQSLVIPMVVSSCVTLIFHVIICWMLVFRSGWGNLGAATAIGLSYWLNVILLSLYVIYSPKCAKTRISPSMEVIHTVGEFFSLAIPSAIMICLEWWSFELLTMLSGLLPNPKLETSVLSVCLATLASLYTIPDGLGAAASTRVSNELGAGNPRAAREAAAAVMLITLSVATILCTFLFAARHVFGCLFSDSEEVISYVASMAPLLCLSVALDNLQGVLSGIARGCGWQDIGAYINLGAYYLCGIPVAGIFGFWAQLRAMGLWIGILTGASVQTILLFIVTLRTDWRNEANKARERVFQRRAPVDDAEAPISEQPSV